MNLIDPFQPATLLWLSPGKKPGADAFDPKHFSISTMPDPHIWLYLHEAVVHGRCRSDTGGRVPWIKQGKEVLNPTDILTLYAKWFTNHH